MKSVDSIIKCVFCKQIYNTPIFLSCCSESICKKHIIPTRKKYKCFNCDYKHDLSTFNYPINKTIQKLIDAEFDKLKFEDDYDDSKKFCFMLKDLSIKLENTIKNPIAYIKEHVSDVKGKVDLLREELKLQIDKVCLEMINELNDFETDCIDNVNKSSKHALYRNEIDALKLEFDYEKSIKDYDLLRIDKVKWNENLRKSAIQLNQVENMQKSLIKDLFMNKSCLFDINIDSNLIEGLLRSGLDLNKSAERKIKFEIKNISKFCYNETGYITSEFIRGDNSELKLNLKVKKSDRNNEYYLSCFIGCNSKNYPVRVKAILKILKSNWALNNMYGKVKNFEHIFEKNGLHGYYEFLNIKDLMDETNGYYDKINDSVWIEAEIIS